MFLALFGISQVKAQINVSGAIADDQGVPLPGTSVIVAGTTLGTQSDFDGNYTISVEEGQVLIFSYIGFVTQRVTVGTQSTINIRMETDASQLDEVVVIGYGTQKEENLTGSVSVVKAEEISRQPVAQASQALTGLVPGLTASQSSGQPGQDGAVIRIRGIGTLGNGSKNNPLILVDGIPDSIDGIDPNDIESISVLKDAAASAIYGSRATNGVILITTKRGKPGRISTSYNTYMGVQSIDENLKFSNSLGYMEAFNSAQPGAYSQETIDLYRSGVGVGTEAAPDTDWVDLLFNSAAIQQYHNISVRGGTEKLQVASSISYTNQEGNIDHFNFKRYSGRFNLDFELSDKLDLAFDLNFRRENQRQPAALTHLTRQAYRLQPLFSAYNDDGTYGPGNGTAQPIAHLNSGSLHENITNYFRGLAKATYRPFDDFSISATYSPQFFERDRENFNSQYTFYDTSGAEPRTALSNDLFKQNQTTFQENFNVLTNWDKEFGNHKVTVMVGYEFYKFNLKVWHASRTGFALTDYRGLDQGPPDTQLNGGSSTLNGLESVFGRINYAYKDKYLMEANVRRDASSRFAPGFRSSTFPSFSVGWVASEEGFLKNSETINFLKFRASWGLLGNQFIFTNATNVGGGSSTVAVGANGEPVAVEVNFPYTALFGLGNADATIGGVPVTGGTQQVLANPELQWETGETKNIAVDAEFLKNRLSMTAEYYVRTTKDILLDVTIPPSVGFAPPTQNAGTVRNKGYELVLGWTDNIGDNFRYGFNFNHSNFDNEITSLGGIDQLPPSDLINRVGGEINAIFGLKVDGLYQESDFDANGNLNANLPTPGFGTIEAGDIKYTDFNGDGQINNDDRTTIGSSFTNETWGLELFMEYKGIDFSASLIGEGGRDVMLTNELGWPLFNGGKIQEWQTEYWTPTNTDSPYPRLHAVSTHPNWRVNETWLMDASYTRLRNVTLGYRLSRDLLENLNISYARIFVSGQNLATWSKMPEGIHPLVPNFSAGSIYPMTKVYTIGLNVTF